MRSGSGLVGAIAATVLLSAPAHAQTIPISVPEVRPVASAPLPDSVQMIMVRNDVPEDRRTAEHAGHYSPVRALFCTASAQVPEPFQGMYAVEMRKPSWVKRQLAGASGHEGYRELMVAMRKVTPMHPGGLYRVSFPDMLERVSTPYNEQNEFFKIYAVDELTEEGVSCASMLRQVDSSGAN